MKLRDLTYFNRSDRIVLITFLTVAILALAVLLLRDGKEEEPQTQTASTTTNVRDGYQKKSLRSSQQYDYYAQPAVAPTLFPFDPNTADSTALLRLGLSPWQVRAIYRYRAKGGIFRHKRDFARLYGLTVNNTGNSSLISVSAATISQPATCLPTTATMPLHRAREMPSDPQPLQPLTQRPTAHTNRPYATNSSPANRSASMPQTRPPCNVCRASVAISHDV